MAVYAYRDVPGVHRPEPVGEFAQLGGRVLVLVERRFTRWRPPTSR
ncbi:hypothetical protein J4573_17860 [Actinomadura barringtoniae]|uniref:Uncharacterized protein n=1 Tax=Actinomadura barringtoniae TaxID=1427535 RepID=A0A939T430_9ACTN|nr:hypothetical protein [Actinomadura barringtoniae]MBO2448973.1 hypothetical protein [Actinomadura barringtoniae]